MKFKKQLLSLALSSVLVFSVFASVAATLNISVGAGGGGSYVSSPLSGTTIGGAGAVVVSLTATPLPTHKFIGWTVLNTGLNTGTISSPSSLNTAFNLLTDDPGGSVNITANFAPLALNNLTVASNNIAMGTVVSSPATPTVLEDTVVTVSATPKPGYKFVKWVSVPAVAFSDATNINASFKMPTTAINVTAQFDTFIVPQLRTIKGYSNYSDYGSVSVPSFANSGDSITIRATPKSGYRFSSWSSNNGGTFGNYRNSTTTFLVPTGTNDIELTANFERDNPTPIYTPRPPQVIYPPAIYPPYDPYRPAPATTPSPIVTMRPSTPKTTGASSGKIIGSSSSKSNSASTYKSAVSSSLGGQSVGVKTAVSNDMFIITPSKTNSTKNATFELKSGEISTKVARIKLPSLSIDVPRTNFKNSDVRIDVEKITSGSVFSAYNSIKNKVAGPWDINLEKQKGDAIDVSLRIKIGQESATSNLAVRKYNRATKTFTAIKNAQWSIVQSGDDYFVKVSDIDSGVYAVYKK